MSSNWLALAIGNSRLHWAWFLGEKLQQAWDTPHLPASVIQQLANCHTIAGFPKEILSPSNLSPQPPDKIKLPLPLSSRKGLGVGGKGEFSFCPPLYLASVVPSQTTLWQAYPDVNIITLDKIPLLGMYPTLGSDRALALYGAGETYGFPILVIDAGTALTFTGADTNRHLVGGAILPGLGLQLQSLAQKTANLPQVEAQNVLSLPPRWALNTPDSIQSGTLYTIIAGMRDFIEAWLEEFPTSRVCLTGGDSNLLLKYMRSHSPQVAARIIFEPHLIFWGMRNVRRAIVPHTPFPTREGG